MAFFGDEIKGPTHWTNLNSLVITMEINDTTKSVYQACHFYGFAPYTIIRNKRNEIIDLKLGFWALVYSFVLVVFFCISVEYASINDPEGGYLVR